LSATGFLYDERYLEHLSGEGHPESPSRLTKTVEFLEKQAWFKELHSLTPRHAEEEWLVSTHSMDYLNRARKACEDGYSYLDTPDVGISERSFDAALLAAGGALELGDKLIKGDIKNGFALLRPPGHHAETEFAMGFCLINNIAVLARYLQKRHGLEKICILDWDVHHGNGTQHTFEADPSVLFVSLHQFPFYPGTGSAWETGTGKGEGATLNCPMRGGSADTDYENAFRTVILPKVDSFKPDAVLISAGFDAHYSDPLANINLSTEFYGWMTERMLEAADKHAGGKLLSLLEGGYNLDYLPRCIALHLQKLAGVPVIKEIA